VPAKAPLFKEMTYYYHPIRILSQDEQKGFADAVRIYPTKERVAEYNHQHMVDLNSVCGCIPRGFRCSNGRVKRCW
jgi:hypothetical protein